MTRGSPRAPSSGASRGAGTGEIERSHTKMTTSLTRNGNPPFPTLENARRCGKKCTSGLGYRPPPRRVAEPDTRDCVCSRRSTTFVARRRALFISTNVARGSRSPLSPRMFDRLLRARDVVESAPPLLAECRPPLLDQSLAGSTERVSLSFTPASRSVARASPSCLLGYASVNLCLDMSVPVAAATYAATPPTESPRENRRRSLDPSGARNASVSASGSAGPGSSGTDATSDADAASAPKPSSPPRTTENGDGDGDGDGADSAKLAAMAAARSSSRGGGAEGGAEGGAAPARLAASARARSSSDADPVPTLVPVSVPVPGTAVPRLAAMAACNSASSSPSRWSPAPAPKTDPATDPATFPATLSTADPPAPMRANACSAAFRARPAFLIVSVCLLSVAASSGVIHRPYSPAGPGAAFASARARRRERQRWNTPRL